MVINTIYDQDVGVEHISTSSKTRYGVGICYFDPATEILKEFNTTTKIPVYPGEKSSRRFYIVKDDVNINPSNVLLKVRNTSSSYEVKISTEADVDINTLPENNVVLEFFSKYPNGIIPFSLHIMNKSTTLEEVSIIFDMEVK